MPKRTDRVAERPDPSTWGLDELMNLSEAARLHWPCGNPISERSLRRLANVGRLPISRLNGKIFVTRRALSKLSECTTMRIADSGDENGGGAGYLADLAAIDRMRRHR